MSFIFSRALVAESLQVNCVEIDAYAPSKLIPMRKPSSSRVKTTEPFLLSRFGMTFEPLTDSDGEELLTLFVEASLAKISARPAQATDLTASEAGSGPKWRGSFAKFDPSVSKWKTAQCSLLGDSEEFSETWPRWGSMLSGECYLRPTPALPICENASGFSERFPTPIRNDAEKRGNFDPIRSYGLAGHVKIWQTPVADDAVERTKGKWNSRGEPKLSAEAKLWPTPTSSLADKGGRVTPNKAREGGTLIEALSARTWPTPCASASKGSSPAALIRKSGKDRSNDRIDHAVMASDGGQLNPEWVEWLMGWPIGHTALEPLATARYHEWLQQHSPSYRAAE